LLANHRYEAEKYDLTDDAPDNAGDEITAAAARAPQPAFCTRRKRSIEALSGRVVLGHVAYWRDAAHAGSGSVGVSYERAIRNVGVGCRRRDRGFRKVRVDLAANFVECLSPLGQDARLSVWSSAGFMDDANLLLSCVAIQQSEWTTRRSKCRY